MPRMAPGTAIPRSGNRLRREYASCYGRDMGARNDQGGLRRPLPQVPLTHPPSPDSPYLIRQARRGEGAAVQQLLNRATPQDGAHRLIDGKVAVPEEHGLRLFGVAQAGNDTICGAVSAGPMNGWLRQGAQPNALQSLTANAIEVLALAVDPKYRGSKLGHRLISWVQEAVITANYRLLLVRIDIERPHLIDYYSRAGFALIEPGRPWLFPAAPGGQMFVEDFQDGYLAYKPLHPKVRCVLIDGGKVFCGVIPGAEPFERELLRLGQLGS